MIPLFLTLQLFTAENMSHAVIASSMIAHGADLSTTSWALGKNGDRFKEANPLLRPFSDDPVKLAIAKMGTATLANYILLKMHVKHPKVVIAVGIAQTIAIGFVAHRNAQLVR